MGRFGKTPLSRSARRSLKEATQRQPLKRLTWLMIGLRLLGGGKVEGLVPVGWVGMGVGWGADAGSDGAGGPRAEQADYTPSLHTGGAPPGGSGLSARQGAGCTCGFPLVHRAAASPGCP